ncbi:MAG: 23S rRNA (adenine(2030)-N(6))-methyltransferase RlmJ [Opitutae bacterium]|nr:23S rRNA (adenine(2030)-N(6))-methyltransferase RlmJ [Opitutae bacterium]
MNYRHHFHAGNFADVLKHALLVQLVRGLQRKDKGFLYLDTHAGRGAYDLAAAAFGDTLTRRPEWPEGIGRLWSLPDLPPALTEYVDMVRAFDRTLGPAGTESVTSIAPQFYPGSPNLVRALARPQDRLALCEKHPEECAALRTELGGAARTGIHEMDGYAALRSMLPPPEKRALVLIDPAFEAQDEFAQIAGGLREALRRFSSGVYAIWYPLTERARVDAFFDELRILSLPPTLVVELSIAGENSSLKLKGCGLVVLNPPWQFDGATQAWLPVLARALAQDAGGGVSQRWLVPE